MNGTSKRVTQGREFLTSAACLVGTAMVMPFSGRALAKNTSGLPVRQIIDTITKEVPGAPFATTVDQLRSGSMDQEVAGIVTTMFPTIDVIEQTVKAGANLIIAHETPFYNNKDETEWLLTDDAYNYKIDLLNKYRIAVSFHLL